LQTKKRAGVIPRMALRSDAYLSDQLSG
jgi:hypothetical protein